ncbi:MAG: isoaspartyl peptidase/L-asparaginase, partial [Clostridiales bacterium]|nr:isoaspartyl peptidase/L-asparaginase [Clostridiales bacterium]
MSYPGICEAARIMGEGGDMPDALCAAIRNAEDNPAFKSVGRGGLPNWDGELEMDAAYMDGASLRYGGVISVQNIKNPIDVARHLSAGQLNCLLSGLGAERYARRNGFAFCNMATAEAREQWEGARAKAGPGAGGAGDTDGESGTGHAGGESGASGTGNGGGADGAGYAGGAGGESGAGRVYAGHDTVCVIGRHGGRMAVGVSTSGLFMKRPGRVGDSPVIGSGFYCDSGVGAAAATGVGEDIMRGCLSYETVRRMGAGASPREAAEAALSAHLGNMEAHGLSAGNIAIIAMSAAGEAGAAANHEAFPYAVSLDGSPPS